ncbi:hypothetical protein [Paenibacillus gansuensis]|uniref:Uncharacterized protein n=1 Tax=Paenibacillus gansuensis TaxID=306542 RepID=A0ABW5PE68_9BACL
MTLFFLAAAFGLYSIGKDGVLLWKGKSWMDLMKYAVLLALSLSLAWYQGSGRSLPNPVDAINQGFGPISKQLNLLLGGKGE